MRALIIVPIVTLKKPVFRVNSIKTYNERKFCDIASVINIRIYSKKYRKLLNRNNYKSEFIR